MMNWWKMTGCRGRKPFNDWCEILCFVQAGFEFQA